jgi:hypothetical protein
MASEAAPDGVPVLDGKVCTLFAIRAQANEPLLVFAAPDVGVFTCAAGRARPVRDPAGPAVGKRGGAHYQDRSHRYEPHLRRVQVLVLALNLVIWYLVLGKFFFSTPLDQITPFHS